MNRAININANCGPRMLASRSIGGVQLPDDAKSVGYKSARPFEVLQVFQSESANFVGTEQEFIDAGHAYRYVQTGQFVRQVV